MKTITTIFTESGFFRLRDLNSDKIECTKRLERLNHTITFECHNVTIMKNAQGGRVIIQEVK